MLLSSITQTTFGFGFSLLATPLLALFFDLKTATPLVALCAVTNALLIVSSSWRSIEVSSAWKLIVASIFGIPVGLQILLLAPSDWARNALGLLLIAISLYNLIRPQLPYLKNPYWAFPVGFVAGILSGAYNAGGPPIVIYGTMRRWPPARFVATLQGYFLPAGMFVLIGHALSGLWTEPILHTYALSIPMLLMGFFTGRFLNRRIPARRFAALLYVGLIALGLLLLFS
jgi:uncharacterized membrane protein YfcA